MNSTLKKYLEFFGAALLLVLIGIKILDKDVLILKNWFSIRSIQISLGSICFVLLLMYIKTDRKDMGPNKLKALNFRLVTVTSLFFGLFVWAIVSQPTLPVTVSLTGVAKTSDIVETQKNVQGVDEHLAKTEVVLSSFRDEQSDKTDSLADQISEFKTTFLDLDSDHRVRQALVNDKLSGLVTSVTKLSTQVEELQRKKDEVASKNEATNSKTEGGAFVWWMWILVFVLVGSVLSSIFFPGYTGLSVKARRYYIPIGVGIVLFYFYHYSPISDSKMAVIPERATAPKDSSVKKETPTAPVKKVEQSTAEPIVSPPKTENVKDSSVQKQEEQKPTIGPVIPAKRKKIIPQYHRPSGNGGKMELRYSKPPH